MANGGAYAYRLAYTNSLGEETVLYSSENVGGEKNTEAGEGLREATDSLDEFFYLDRLEAGTKSYLDFFPPTVDESSLDKSWLSQTLKSRKDYYRRNRDLCIIACVGVYLLCMLDAYVDAQLSHFDISQDISMDVAPAVIINPGYRRPTLGLNWALTF